MRNSILAVMQVLFVGTLSAQGVFSNKTHTILEKVIQDYPNHFYNIKGELIGQALQTSRYKSTLQLPGSSSSTIFVSTAAHEESGWTCTIQETTDFEAARKHFQEIYNQLSNSIITSGDQKTFILSGQYESPAEDRKVTRIVFSLLPGVGELKKLKVDLCLCQNPDGTWKIELTVTDQESKEESQVASTSQ
jgi:hypothetical protein